MEILSCGDNGCEFHTPKVGTNGGCRCLKHIRPTSERIEVTRKVRNLRSRLRLMEEALHKALCIIENDAESPPQDKGSIRIRWVNELVEESGIDRRVIRSRK